MLKNNKEREDFICSESNWNLVIEHPDGFRVKKLEICSLTFYRFDIRVPTFYKLNDSEPDTLWITISIRKKQGKDRFNHVNYSFNAMVTEIRNLKEK